MLGELSNIGNSMKPFGNDGAIKVNFSLDIKDFSLKNKFIFFELGGCMIPFRVLEESQNKNHLIVIENYTSPEEVNFLRNKSIFFLKSELPKSKSSNDVPQMIGFKVMIKSDADFDGTLLRMEEYPSQMMAIIQSQETEVLIPWNENFISEIDFESRIIHFDIPDGLLNLNN